MRNLVEYPITPDEIKATIKRQLERIESDNASGRMQIGNIDGLIWAALLQVLDDPIYLDGSKVIDLVLEAAKYDTAKS